MKRRIIKKQSSRKLGDFILQGFVQPLLYFCVELLKVKQQLADPKSEIVPAPPESQFADIYIHSSYI